MRLSKEFKPFDQAAYRHTIMDGLTEILMGIFLLLIAVAVSFGPYGLLVYLAPLVFLPALRFLQNRYTAPRVGYVEPAADKPKEVLPGILLYCLLLLAAAWAIAFLASGGLVRPDYALMWQRLHQWSPALAGIAVAGGLWYAGSRSGLRRFFVAAVGSVALGVVVTALCCVPGVPFLRGDGVRGLQAYLVAMGGLSLISGLIVFARFLRSHPVQSSEATNAHPR